MTFSYIYNVVNPYWCVGNSLSTINMNFTALDVALSALSAYTVASVNFLSSTMIAVSSTLESEIESLSALVSSEINFLSANNQFLQSEINYLSANTVLNYYQEGTIYQASNGIIAWNFANDGRNVRVVLSANGFLQNISGANSGEIGNIVIQSNGVSGYTLTGYGSQWMFSGGLSSMTTAISSYNRIEVFNDQNTKFLGTMFKY